MTEEEEEEEEEEEKEEVLLPTIHPHPLIPYKMVGDMCEMCFGEANSYDTDGYWCDTCEWRCHKGCAESASETRHPYHPPHPLTLRPLERRETWVRCSCCGEETGGGWVYHCPTCPFFMRLRCAKEPPLLQVDRPKSHDHSLSLLPKPRPFTCDACGLMLHGCSLPYACLQCGVMLHKDCIDLQHVIRISRHQHRLLYVSSPPLHHEAWSCSICRSAVGNDYGAYSCIKGCPYVAHPNCATRKDMWDGEDLEGEPEEPDEDVEPFEVIDDKVVHHFGHEHHLKLVENDGGGFDGSQHCQACALPIRIHVGNIYSCTKRGCGFILHETCARMPRKIWYMTHPHRLTLQTAATHHSWCRVCRRRNCGFSYSCCERRCRYEIDMNCASVTEPILHESHPHPLFSTLSPRNRQACSGCKEKEMYLLGCKEEGMYQKMQCIECDFVLCFKCITLPPKVRYKPDRHPLALRGREDAKDTYWCEICERRLDPERLFYTCDECCVTVHVECILGENPHMKPGSYSDETRREIKIEANDSCSRPLCHQCERHCPYPIFYKRNDLIYCTLSCSLGYGWSTFPFMPT